MRNTISSSDPGGIVRTSRASKVARSTPAANQRAAEQAFEEKAEQLGQAEQALLAARQELASATVQLTQHREQSQAVAAELSAMRSERDRLSRERASAQQQASEASARLGASESAHEQHKLSAQLQFDQKLARCVQSSEESLRNQHAAAIAQVQTTHRQELAAASEKSRQLEAHEHAVADILLACHDLHHQTAPPFGSPR